ncbi:MAG: cation:proton antiporter subunit C [Gemmatimonadetes bacterium]|nr:cation:proton antiporter subunit C [Gemmatimonadota bacterium]
MSVTAHYNYWIAILLMMIGLYAVIALPNLVKKLVGLSLFQTGIFLFYISIGKVAGGTAPIYWEAAGRDPARYTNALPTALILTAIVVSVSTTAVALAIVVSIKRAYGTVEMPDIENADVE